MKKVNIICFALVLLLTLGVTSQIAYALYPTTDPWPMWRYDAQHHAYGTSSAPTSNKTIWATSQANPYYPRGPTPIVVDGKVIFFAQGPVVVALDETTGVEIWRTTFPIVGSVDYAHPSYSDGRVFLTTYNGYLYGINVTTGAKIWENQLTSTGNIVSSPTISQGRVFVGTTDNYLFAVNATTGQYGVWYYQAQGAIRSTPAVSGNMVYFGAEDHRVYALDMSNPAGFILAWRFMTNSSLPSSPSIGSGKVFIGTGYVDHAVLALNATTTNFNGQLIWKYVLDAQADVLSSPAFYNNVLYFTGYSGKVYALNANTSPGKYTENQPGCKIWSQTIGDYRVYYYSVALADGKVFATNGHDMLYALSMADGTILSWRVQFPAYYGPREPVVSDGRVFTTNYWSVFSFGEYFPPVTYYYTVTPPGAGGQSFKIKLVIANATPSQTINTQLLVSLKRFNYTAIGIDGSKGMSNITIPDEMLGGPYFVRINGGIPSPQPVVVNNGTHSSIYFTYFQSINNIEITGTTVIPEFLPTIILPLLAMLSLIAVFLAKKKPPEN